MNDEKIGMYSTDDILAFMTEGEGRGFLGRSMFDAMYFEIKQLQSQLEEYENMRKEAINYVKWQRNNPQYDNVWRNSECESLLNILNKVGGNNE